MAKFVCGSSKLYNKVSGLNKKIGEDFLSCIPKLNFSIENLSQQIGPTTKF